VPLGPVQAILIAVLMVHGVAPGPLMIAQQPQLFWGFIASMYIGNLVLLMLNLPLVGLFVSFLRLPYAYLYPIILVCCVVGVYTVNFSMVDVLIMAAAGAAGYALRRMGYDVAPIVLGFILSPMLEMAFRQSLAMSGGDYAIFLQRPVAVALLAVGAVVLLIGLVPSILRRPRRVGKGAARA
jgi:TctA family transporter